MQSTKFLKILVLIFLVLGQTIWAQVLKPKILISFPKSIRTNEEIEVLASISNLKKVPYDLKISIEKEGKVLSEIYNLKEGKWQSSLYYIKNLFSGPSFEGKLKLRMKKEFLFFEGEAEIILRVRESGKSSYSEYRGKIKILKPEIKKEEKKEKFLAEIPKNSKEEKISPKVIGILNSIFCTSIILFLKLKLRGSKFEK